MQLECRVHNAVFLFGPKYLSIKMKYMADSHSFFFKDFEKITYVVKFSTAHPITG